MNTDDSTFAQTFRVPDGRYSFEHLKYGHINKTFRVKRDGKPVFILQQLNTSVFNNPDLLMANYRLVSETLSAYRWPESVSLKVPEIIPTCEGKLYSIDNQSDCWRLITYIDGRDITMVPRDANTAYEGGLAFGAFLKGVSGIDPNLLHTILPDFHSFEKRYRDFITSVNSDPIGRAALVSKEIEFVKSRYPAMMKVPDAIAAGFIPERIVHNDTKLTNVIFSGIGKAVGVIDLDTVMPGSALFDFGDAIRSCANPANEDEQDLTKVIFEIGFFEAFSRGYLESTNGLLSVAEKDLLPVSALLLTCIIGIRFLTDYLNGDVYYQTQYPEHNLVRARVQFRLLIQMESQLAQMHDMINQIEKSLHRK
jgi:Ser/Thr protein kinase RdoA (MazF antagonist)